jgi:hypothetical protein
VRGHCQAVSYADDRDVDDPNSGAADAESGQLVAERRDPDVPADIAAVTGDWQREEASLEQWTLRAGDRTLRFTADRATGNAITRALAAVPELVAKLQRKNDAMSDEIEELHEALQEAKRRPATVPAKSAAPPAKKANPELSSLEHVPLAMIGGFTLTPKLKAAAKKDPLVALAVQVDKAMAPDGSDLDRARLVAMANAIARGDLATFWAASTERSKKKLGG